MVRTSIAFTAICCVLFTASATTSPAENWPQWRGPTGNSISSEKKLPIVWNNERGVLWKTDLPEWGSSTPAIWGNAIFLTSHQEDKLLLLKIDAGQPNSESKSKPGEVLWTKTVGSGQVDRAPVKKKTDDERRSQKFHQLHNFASPSPMTDGKTVVVHFGNGDLAAYDFDGNQLWKRNLQDDYGNYTIWWGHANSPLIYKNLVISACMQDSLDGVVSPLSPSYLVAHDIRTGRERWKTMRMTGAKAEENDSYTTPVLRSYRSNDDDPASPAVDEIVVMGSNQLDSYDPAKGKQLWSLPGIVGGRTVTGPTVVGDWIFTTQGMRGPLLAIKPGKQSTGELPKAKHVAWKIEKGTPDSCSPVCWNELLFAVNDDGIAKCYDTTTGISKWTERLKGGYKASPVAADGKIYFLNTEGLCTIIAADSRFERLAENAIADQFVASPAISAGKIYLRGKQALYCVGE